MEPICKSPLSSPSNNKISSIFSLLLILLFLLPHCHSDSDNTALVYNHCTNNINNNQATTTNDPLSQTLSSLFQALITQSSKSTFHRESAAQNGVSISALYQCRGDMSPIACQSCVTQLGILSNRLCAGAESARVQLRGCYMSYEGDWVLEGLKKYDELVHKGCGESEGVNNGGFEVGARDAALAAVEEGVGSGNNGFYEARFEGVRAMAQCQGDLLWGCDCAECVSAAVEVAREECGRALSGEVYLDGCFVSYTTYPQGEKKNGSGGKLVAIVLGGAATLVLGFILLMFFKSCGKKDDD